MVVMLDDETKKEEPESLYKPEKKTTGLKSNLKRLTKHKLLLFGVGGTASGGIIGIGIIIFLASSLSLTNLTQVIESYAFASTTRYFTNMATNVTDQNLAVSAAPSAAPNTLLGETAANPGGIYGSFKDTYQSLIDNTWGKLNSIRPQAIIDNLGQNNGLTLNYKTTAFGREIFTGATLDGVDYPVAELSGISSYVPILKNVMNVKNYADFYAKFQPAVTGAMDTAGVNEISQGLVMRALIKLTNGNLGGWILSKFNKTPETPKELPAIEAQQLDGDTQSGNYNPVTASDSTINKAANDAQNVANQDSLNLKAVEDTLANNGIDTNVQNVINKDFSTSLLGKVENLAAGFLDPIFNLAIPACIVYDGSVVQSGPTINNQTNQQQNLFDGLASQADEQKAGGPIGSTSSSGALANAVSATNQNLGNISQSDAEILANGGSINTSSIISPEAGAGGSYNYSILTTLGITPTSVSGKVITGIFNQCRVLTSPKLAIGVGAATLIFTDGGDAFLTGTLKTSLDKLMSGDIAGIISDIKSYLTTETITTSTEGGINVATSSTGLSRSMKFIVHQGKILLGTAALTEIAHLIVASQAGLINNGLAQGTDLSNEALSGALIQSNNINRSQMFGRPLTQTEMAQNSQQNSKALADTLSKKSAFSRYASLSNPYSLLSRLAVISSGLIHLSSITNFMKLAGDILNPLKAFGTIFSALDHSVVLAANTANPINSNFGIVEFGWSNSELNLINSNSSYAPLENQQILDNSGKEIAIAKQYATCFGYQYNPNGDGSLDPTDPNSNMQISTSGSIGTLLSTGAIMRNSQGYVTNSGLCSKSQLGVNNKVYGDLVFRWRLAMAYDTTMNQLCQESVGPINNPASNKCSGVSKP